jgi:hypothetical protein
MQAGGWPPSPLAWSGNDPASIRVHRVVWPSDHIGEVSACCRGVTVEEAIVRAFIAPHRRARWLFSLGSAKRRQRFLDCLNHCADLNPRYGQSVSSSADLVALLRAQGAPSLCHVVSAVASIDGREMSLVEAVAAAESAGWGTIISCIPGRLACYIDEAGTRWRLLLVRVETEEAAAPDPVGG